MTQIWTNSDYQITKPRKIAIVGAGIVGLATAFRLAQQRQSVVVFDKGLPGGEASWAGAGMLAPGGEIEDQSALAALAVESLRSYPDFIRELEDAENSIDFQRCGALDLVYSEEEQRALDARAHSQSGLGIRSRAVTPEEVQKFWPLLQREGLLGGRFYPEDAIVNPRDVVQALLRNCALYGVNIRPNCPVTGVTISDRGASLSFSEDTESFDAVVIAAGAWSGSIPVTGVPALPASKPIKGQLLGYHQPDQTCNTIIRRGHTYMLQRSSGLLIVGASVQDKGFDRVVEPEIASELAAQASFLLPHLGETTPTDSWVGFRPSADSLHIGRWHSASLLLAYGHYRNGILLAPVTATRVAAEFNARPETPTAFPATH